MPRIVVKRVASVAVAVVQQMQQRRGREHGSQALGLVSQPIPHAWPSPSPQLLVPVGHSEICWDLGMPWDPVETVILAQSQEASPRSACSCQSSKEAPRNACSLCQAKRVRWCSAKHPQGQAGPPCCSFQML